MVNGEWPVMKATRSFFNTSRLHGTRGTALVETAIVLPLYMLVLLGLIYFGYATLTRQRQTTAASCAAWLPGEQHDDDLLGEFWRASGGVSEDMTFDSDEAIRLDDPYYGNIVPTQLVAGMGSLGAGSDETFHRERVAVSLWNLALGEVYQSFVWDPVEGFAERVDVRWDDYSRYLNVEFPTGFVDAHAGASPVIGEVETWIASGLSGGDGEHWLERRQVGLWARYRPSFFPQIVRGADDAPSDFSSYISGNYDAPDEAPPPEMTFDLTGRGEAERRAVGEGIQSEELADDAATFLQMALSEPDELDSMIEAVLGPDAWTAR